MSVSCLICTGGNCCSLQEENRKSWYKIPDFDIAGRRKQENTSIEEVVDIYRAAGLYLQQTAEQLNADIDTVQRLYGFENNNTFLAGFSQGAMLALWTALSRKQKIAGCFCLSGLVAAADRLSKYIVTTPKVYLLHGKQDVQVRYKCLPYTQQWLHEKNIEAEAVSFADLGHEVVPSELDFIASIVNSL